MAMTRTTAPSVHSHARWFARSTTAPCEVAGQVVGSGGGNVGRGAGCEPDPAAPGVTAAPEDGPDHLRGPVAIPPLSAGAASASAVTADLHMASAWHGPRADVRHRHPLLAASSRGSGGHQRHGHAEPELGPDRRDLPTGLDGRGHRTDAVRADVLGGDIEVLD